MLRRSAATRRGCPTRRGEYRGLAQPACATCVRSLRWAHIQDGVRPRSELPQAPAAVDAWERVPTPRLPRRRGERCARADQSGVRTYGLGYGRAPNSRQRRRRQPGGWHLATPFTPPVFSDRVGAVKPVWRLLGFRLFRLPPVSPGLPWIVVSNAK